MQERAYREALEFVLEEIEMDEAGRCMISERTIEIELDKTAVCIHCKKEKLIKDMAVFNVCDSCVIEYLKNYKKEFGD